MNPGTVGTDSMEMAVDDSPVAVPVIRAKRPRALSPRPEGKIHTPDIQSQFVKKKSREDTALSRLTQRFAALLDGSKTCEVDLNVAAKELNVPKRRFYDVINVLAGVNVIQRKYKSVFQYNLQTKVANKSKNQELMRLYEEEKELDDMIESCTLQLYQMSEDEPNHRFAYLTCEDIKSIPDLKDQTVIVIKGPEETSLDIPDPNQKLQIHLKSTRGPVDVLLCPDDPKDFVDTDHFMAYGAQSNLSPPLSFEEGSSKNNPIIPPADGNHTPEVSLSDTPPRPAQHSCRVTLLPTSPLSEDQQNFVPMAISLTVGSSPS